MSPFDEVFYEVAALLATATFVGALALWLRQPLIIAFIAVGILVGPAGFGIFAATETLELFAELGIALLLFVVGLKLDPNEIREVGPVAIATGIGQIVMTGGLGYLIAMGLGMEPVAAFYVAIALTFSSTIIIVKLLSDKREIDALHSRIAVGVLIVQDIVVVLVMIALTVFNGDLQGGNVALAIFLVVLKGTGFLLVLALFARYLLANLLHFVACSTELLLLFAITWAIALGALADHIGFSKEVGAFLAGVAIASTPYRAIVGARLVTLRDFLLLFFFINLGIHIDISHLGAQLLPGIVFSLFVLLGKPVMVMALVGGMGYRKYTSAITSLSLCQISEFSLILASLGVSLGHISGEIMGLITLVGLITMGVSTYLILYSHLLYNYLAPWLGIFERKMPHPEGSLGKLSAADLLNIDVILFGLGRYGGSMIQDLQKQGLGVLGVDFDPEMVRLWRSQGIFTLYGDVEDPEFAKALPLNYAKWVVSTIPGKNHGLTLLHTLKHYQFPGCIALTSHSLAEMEVLEEDGADLILLPFRDAATEAAHTLVECMNSDREEELL